MFYCVMQDSKFKKNKSYYSNNQSVVLYENTRLYYFVNVYVTLLETFEWLIESLENKGEKGNKWYTNTCTKTKNPLMIQKRRISRPSVL